MNLFNSLTKQTESFDCLSNDKARIYTCGPTVYDNVHIGNLSSFIYADTLARVLRNKFKVEHVINITDVDDKTIKRSQELFPELSSMDALLKLTRDYEEKFKSDIAALNINTSNYTFIRATESIDLMQELINKLLNAGFAYLSDDGIYFSIDKYRKSGKKYGKLTHLDFSQTDSSKSRINNDEYDKQTVHDFALWKFAKKGEPSWDFEINNNNYSGRPGWHIECSAMSTSLLGQPFDIHTGGIDLKFPHHENEIAQSTTDIDTQYLSRFFFHSEHLLVDNQKMSKSLNNFYSLSDLLKRINNPLAFRLFVLQSNYRNRTDFSFDNLDASNRRLLSYINFASLKFQIDASNQSKKIDLDTIQSTIEESMNDDLNSANALAELSIFINSVGNNRINNNQLPDFINFLIFLDNLLGLNLSDSKDITSEQKKLLYDRLLAKQQKDWQKSDAIRDQLVSDGVGINDTDSNQIWYRI
ncbi:MAG TPA: cysteine--tRNA ligase [Candidatus Dormibacteraeota bacterium]|nr:cysteine--tRNA ligase [Candidatus Dormibacteraeota bacterium]